MLLFGLYLPKTMFRINTNLNKYKTMNDLKNHEKAENNTLLGDVVLIQSNSWNITNKLHLNSINRKNDTLCSKNFSFPESDTELITFEDGELYKGGIKIIKENLCQRCLAVFMHNIA